MDVPVQYFQSVIAIELAVSGPLLWQMRFFESSITRREAGSLPDAQLRVALEARSMSLEESRLALNALEMRCAGDREVVPILQRLLRRVSPLAMPRFD